MKVTFLSNTNAVSEVLARQDAILFHVCNDCGVMGSGIALEIKKRIQSAYDNYKTEYDMSGRDSISRISFSTELNVCNLVAQSGFGQGTRHIHYGMLVRTLTKAVELSVHCLDKKVAIIPFKMGADRAGGDWDTVLEITQEILSRHFEELIICSL